MSHKPIANRKRELDFFLSMLTGKTPKRILLVEAASGKGKTDLLECFSHECADGISLVSLNLKNAEKGISEVFSAFRQELGAHAFPHLNSTYTRLNSSVNISDNSAGGDMRIDIASLLRVESEQTRQLYLAQLEEAFFEDLSVLSANIVIIFDTFEKAPDDLQKWLSGGFLRGVARLPHMRIVIGGQIVPEHSVERWEMICERHRLDDIQDVDEWLEYVRARQWKFDRLYVQGIVDALNGFPRNVTITLESKASQWK